MTVQTADAPRTADFDFQFGHWTVEHRRLVARGVGCDDWDSFESTSQCRPQLGGVANVEEQVCAARGWMGMAVRTLDRATGEWSIYWISDADGRMQPPVRGRFRDGLGRFEGPDVDGGRPIIARYEWSRTDTAHPRWTQSFSYDDGATWEVNWIMDFTSA
ncbi:MULTISPECIES: DUF1579 domain-containing protein [unclassified Brevundimonas]|uniref:DUF1579 domain-containing protein n=1 Tax=unclassified Brevundimonas TaxID=2622653 RepID=UPI003F911770